MTSLTPNGSMVLRFLSRQRVHVSTPSIARWFRTGREPVREILLYELWVRDLVGRRHMEDGEVWKVTDRGAEVAREVEVPMDPWAVLETAGRRQR